MATVNKYFNSAGSISVTFPPDVTTVVVEGIGGGGAGAYRNSTGNGGGGSGGAYAKLNSFAVSFGTNYSGVVGAGGNSANNANGVNTTFNSTTLIAKGGVTAGRNNATGQAAATSSTGDVTHDAGAGANNGTSVGGGGGSSGGNAANGRAGQVQVGGGNGSDSGNLPAGAGAGGNGASSGNANGSTGVFPGGAGGGSTRTAGNHLGGNGANGQLKFTYVTTVYTDQHQDSEGTNFGFGEFAIVRYRGQRFTPTNSDKLVGVGFSRNKGSQGVKVYIDTITSGIPTHSVGSELYSFTITNANIIDGYGEYYLPVGLQLTAGTEYCFYMAPWNTGTDAYQDDYQDAHGVNPGSGSREITNVNGTWSNENLDFHYATLMQQASNIKTVNGLARASVKTMNGLAIASVKTRNTLS